MDLHDTLVGFYLGFHRVGCDVIGNATDRVVWFQEKAEQSLA